MPIVDLAQPDIFTPRDTPKGFAVTPGQADVDHGQDAPDWSTTAGAAFRQGNEIGSLMAADRGYTFQKEEGFNPWDRLKGSKYEPFWSSFADIRNSADFDRRTQQIDQENEDRKIIDASPWYKSVPLEIAAGIASPTTFLPGGAFVRGGKGGFSVARSALNVAGGAAAATTAQEAMLHGIQETRPVSESVANIGASIVLGGLLGAGGARLLTQAEWAGAVRAVERELAGGTQPAAMSGPADGFVRFYHGGSNAGEGPVWLSPQRDYAEGYARGQEGGQVFYVDVPRDEAIKLGGYDDINGYAQNFEAPVEYQKQLQALDGERGLAAGSDVKEWRIVDAPPEFFELSNAEKQAHDDYVDLKNRWQDAYDNDSSSPEFLALNDELTAAKQKWRDAERATNDFVAKTAGSSGGASPLGGAAADAKPVYDDVLKQLTDAGMSESEASVNAAVFAARYATRAKRLGDGQSPLDVYRADGLEIRGSEAPDGPVEVGIRQFDQTANRGNNHAMIVKSFDEIRQALEEHETLFVRWSQSEAHDMSPGARSRDYQSGKEHDGLSAQAINKDYSDDEIFRFLRDYGYLRSSGNDEAVPRLYVGKIVGKDSDGADTIIPTKYIGRLSDELIRFIDDDVNRQRMLLSEQLEQGRRALALYEKEPPKYIPIWTHERVAEIEEKLITLGGPVPMPGGKKNVVSEAHQSAADPRGKITVYKDNSAVIDLFRKADKSTFMHESAHLWLGEMIRDAAKSASVKSDLDSTLKWFGVDDASKIELKHHEQWARGFEEYLREGSAPSAGLAKAFESFKEWLTAIYRSIAQLGPDHVPISDDIRKVMDRMLATDEEIAARASAASGNAAPLGAAAATVSSLDANSIAGRAASAVADKTSWLNPSLRLNTSPSAVARDVAGKLFENSVYLNKNMEGFASDQAVETFMKEWNGGLAQAVAMTNSGFSDYVKAAGGGRLAELFPSRYGLMTHAEFREAVGRAMRRSDEDANPYVAKVAKEWRAKVFDPLKEAAIEQGLLPRDVSVETAATYFTRMWNRNKLIAREGEFKNVVRRWVEDNAPRWAAAYDRQVERSLSPLHQEIADLEMAKLRRAEELRARDAGGEVEAGEFNESDIRQALRIVQGGAPKPKGVDTLTQFVAKAGGLVDFGGELAHRGINNKARPGFVRAERKRAQTEGGGWALDDMARHAWENGYFPEHIDRPSVDDFLNALQDDFFKTRPVLREGDRDAYKLTQLVNELEADLARVGIVDTKGPKFATSEEVKGMVSRVFKALDAEADKRLTALKAKLAERQAVANVEREARFLGEPQELSKDIADEVFNTLTGKTGDGVRPEYLTIKARGPLKERTFNIPDELVEDFLEHDVEHVGRRYSRVMGADVELARKFGSVDMVEQLAKVREDYQRLRDAIPLTDAEGNARPKSEIEKARRELSDSEARDVGGTDSRGKKHYGDLPELRDILRGSRQEGKIEQNYGKIVRSANHINYLRSMGEVVLASITDAVRPAMVHGLGQFMQTVPQMLTNMKGIKLSVAEAQKAGNVAERVLAHRLETMADLNDPYASRGPIEGFLENMTNVASKWNGIRVWTDAMKSIASVMTQDRIIKNALGYGKIAPKEKAYMAFLGIDESMAGRIKGQFETHGETVDGVRVANTEQWTDAVARRAYRAAMNKDVDSIIIQQSVADIPLFARSPLGKTLLQFKSFALASHQKVLLRGLQEDQSRFIGGVVAMTAMGMLITYLKAISGNRPEAREKMMNNPGWWIGEGLDRAGILSVPMELANAFEKGTGFNPIKAPFKAFDAGDAISQKNQNRSDIGSLLGPTVGMAGDVMSVGTIPKKLLAGEEVTQGQKNAAERLLPFNSYLGMRQMLRYVANPPQ